MDARRRQIGPAADAASPLPELRRADLRHYMARVAQWLAKPSVVVATSVFAGAACAVTGISMLLGVPWGLIAGAVILFGLADLILRGMNG